MTQKAHTPNISPISNLFPVRTTLATDEEFQRNVRGRAAISTMIRAVKGAQRMHIDEIERMLTPDQNQRWNFDSPCSLLDDKELVFGPLLRNGKITTACKCYKVDCRQFSICRPGVSADLVKKAHQKVLDSLGDDSYTSPFTMSSQDNDIIILGEETSLVSETEPVTAKVSVDTRIKVGAKDETEDDRSARNKIIHAPSDAHLFVSAGPGTGKTHTLIERIKHMVMNDREMNPADEMLVLCFTRTAVREVKERLHAAVESEGLTGDLYQLNIRTFDSFATYLLSELEIETRGKSYDDRIELAIGALNDSEDTILGLKHLFVDEIQDLVGVRARFVQALLNHTAGFTLLGDPLQGIYDYQVNDKANEPDSQEFLRCVQDMYSTSLQYFRLTVNYRQTPQWSQYVNQARVWLESGEQSKREKFMRSVQDLEISGKFYKPNIQYNQNKKIGILCRTNGEVLKLTSHLRKDGIPHTIRKQQMTALLPSWVADAFIIGTDSLTLPMWQEWNEQHYQLSTHEVVRRYNLLKKIENREPAFLDVEILRKQLSTQGYVPEEMNEEVESTVCLTTIHQSKGREFDTVYVVGRSDNVQYDLMDESKVYYVAVTRAREQLFTIEPVRRNYFRKGPQGRWLELSNKKGGGRKLVNLEITSEDIEVKSFVSSNHNARDNQEYLHQVVKSGDPIEIIFDDEMQRYKLLHCDRMIGWMKESFNAELRAVLVDVYGPLVKHSPKSFENLYVQQIHTIVQKPETLGSEVESSYASMGVWLGISIVGFGSVRWQFD